MFVGNVCIRKQTTWYFSSIFVWKCRFSIFYTFTQNGGHKQVAYKHAFLKYKEKFSFLQLFFFFFFLQMSGDQKSSNGYCGIICTWWCGERMWFRSGVTCRSADIRFQCSAKHILQIIYKAPRDLLYPTPTPNPPSIPPCSHPSRHWFPYCSLNIRGTFLP